MNSNLSTELGGRINIDISSVQTQSYRGANFWLLIQDDFTGYLWSYFIKAKSDIPDSFFDWLQLVKKGFSLDVKRLILENSGEYKFHQKVQKSNYNIKFEFAAPGTPQQNGKAERDFATLNGKIRSLLKSARVTTTLRQGLWACCASLAVQLQNIIVYQKNENLHLRKFMVPIQNGIPK
jgi:transposase InsO family protein